MNNYSSLRNLSVVEHNQMLVPRTNAKTETARINALNLLLLEMLARREYQIKETMVNRKTIIKASHKTNLALNAFFKAKEQDDTHEPIFKVV